jgi:SRSO17 transposase
MRTTEDQTVAAVHSVELDPARWQELFDELLGRVAGRFARVELRQRARAFVRGLLADLPRKNCWTIAEHAGDASPDGMQHLLARAAWDEDAVRDDIRDYVIEHLGQDGAVLVIDETGDLKKGTATVGVKRQYTGTAGRVENAQVAVYLVYATNAGHAVVDRELYLPRSWTDDPDRLQAAGVPDQVGFATKPALATKMITRALDAGVPAAWVAGDEVYGANPGLRAELEATGVGYVLAAACDHPVRFGGATHRADALLRQVPARAWQQISCGTGAKGHRLYQWAFVRLDHDRPAPDGQAGTGSWSAATTRPASWPSTAAPRPVPPRWPSWSRSPGGAGPSRCVNHSALIYASWLHNLGSRCGLVALSRPSVGGCTSRAGGTGAGGARRAGGGRRG